MGHERTAPFHEVYLLICDDHTLQGLDLAAQFVGKAIGIDRVVAVDKLITHLCTGIIVDDGTAHGELIKVVVGEMVDDLSHCFYSSFACKYTIFTRSSGKVSLKITPIACYFQCARAVPHGRTDA